MRLKHLLIIAGVLVLAACGQKGPLMHKKDVESSSETKPAEQSKAEQTGSEPPKNQTDQEQS